MLTAREAEASATKRALAKAKASNKNLRSQIAEMRRKLRSQKSERRASISLVAKGKREKQELAREAASLSHALTEATSALGAEREKTARLIKMLHFMKDDQIQAKKRRKIRVEECATNLLLFVAELRGQSKISMNQVRKMKDTVVEFINLDSREARLESERRYSQGVHGRGSTGGRG